MKAFAVRRIVRAARSAGSLSSAPFRLGVRLKVPPRGSFLGRPAVKAAISRTNPWVAPAGSVWNIVV